MVAAAWNEDEDWGMFVWLTLVAGARRGELLALRWKHVDTASGVLTIWHSVSALSGPATTKDTKTHQSRRISLNAETVALLTEHRERVTARCVAVGGGFDDGRFLFSWRPTTPDRAVQMVSRTGTRAWSAS